MSLEVKQEKFDYGCVLLRLNFPNWLDNLSQFHPDDIYYGQNEDGVVVKPHVTILYGIKPEVTLEQVESLIYQINRAKIDIVLGEVDAFTNDNYDVAKIPIYSEYLAELNKLFSTLPNENLYPEYKPHITLAYLNKGASEKYNGMKISTLFTLGELEYSNGDLIKIY